MASLPDSSRFMVSSPHPLHTFMMTRTGKKTRTKMSFLRVPLANWERNWSPKKRKHQNRWVTVGVELGFFNYIFIPGKAKKGAAGDWYTASKKYDSPIWYTNLEWECLCCFENSSDKVISLYCFAKKDTTGNRVVFPVHTCVQRQLGKLTWT